MVIRNEPGGLHEVMGVFASHRVDMTQIVARPIKGAPWQYRFYMEVRADSSAELTTCLRVLDGVAVQHARLWDLLALRRGRSRLNGAVGPPPFQRHNDHRREDHGDGHPGSEVDLLIGEEPSE